MDFILRSSISSEFLKKILIKGTLISGLGMSILVLAGAFLPIESLQRWGIWIFAFAMGCTAWGLIPYKRLQKLQTSPDEIRVTEDHILHYVKNQKEVYRLPLSDIQKVRWIDKPNIYGICLELKSTSKPFLFPYFSKKSFLEFSELHCLSKESINFSD